MKFVRPVAKRPRIGHTKVEMTDQRRPPTPKPASPSRQAPSRQDREAAALRANLARRKVQSRGRAAVEGEADAPAGTAERDTGGRDDETRG
jgi:hypothetical protein